MSEQPSNGRYSDERSRREDVELDVPTPLGLLRTKGYRAMDVVLMTAVVAVVAGPAVGFYMHKTEMREQADMFLMQLKQQAERNQKTLRDADELANKQIVALVASVRELTVATRYQACVAALPEKQRWSELQRGGWCDQMARQGVIPP